MRPGDHDTPVQPVTCVALRVSVTQCLFCILSRLLILTWTMDARRGSGISIPVAGPGVAKAITTLIRTTFSQPRTSLRPQGWRPARRRPGTSPCTVAATCPPPPAPSWSTRPTCPPTATGSRPPPCPCSTPRPRVTPLLYRATPPSPSWDLSSLRDSDGRVASMLKYSMLRQGE